MCDLCGRKRGVKCATRGCKARTHYYEFCATCARRLEAETRGSPVRKLKVNVTAARTALLILAEAAERGLTATARIGTHDSEIQIHGAAEAFMRGLGPLKETARTHGSVHVATVCDGIEVCWCCPEEDWKPDGSEKARAVVDAILAAPPEADLSTVESEG